MIKPSPHCWLYLDCESMTGYPENECPNIKECQYQAESSDSRACELPYSYWEADPSLDQLFDHPGDKRLAVLCFLSDEAIAAGWHPPESLQWCYRDGVLWIGKDPEHYYGIEIHPDAQALGFARAQPFPYIYEPEKNQLRVSQYHWHYPDDLRQAGWCPALDLPYFYRDALVVGFPFRNPEYQEAIAAGWYPAEFLAEFDPYHCDDDDTDDEW